MVLESSFKGLVLAHVIGILFTCGSDTARTPVDPLVAEEKIAKSVDSDLRTFGDSSVVCLGARLAENLLTRGDDTKK